MSASKDQKQLINKLMADLYGANEIEYNDKHRTFLEKNISEIEYTNEFTIWGDIIQPIFNEYFLWYIKNSLPLANLINTYATNVCEYGWRLEKDFEGDEDENDLNEKDKMMRVLRNVNRKKGLTGVLKEWTVNALTWGYGGLAGNFNPVKERLKFEVIPGHQFRYTILDKKLTDYEYWDGDEFISDSDRFRRYVQTREIGNIFFKDIDDPRTVDYETGKYIPNKLSDKAADFCEPLEFGFKLDSIYPYPIWFSAREDIEGNIYATRLNKNVFEDGFMVPMALMIANGKLSDKARRSLEVFFRQNKGYKKGNSLLVLEVEQEGSEMSLEGGPAVKVNFEKLPAFDKSDASFLNYLQETKTNIRNMFNIPNLFLGQEEGYNRATAQVMFEYGRDYVFTPLRELVQSKINKILAHIGYTKYKFKLNTPKLNNYNDSYEMIEFLAGRGVVDNDDLEEIRDDLFNNTKRKVDNDGEVEEIADEQEAISENSVEEENTEEDNGIEIVEMP